MNMEDNGEIELYVECEQWSREVANIKSLLQTCLQALWQVLPSYRKQTISVLLTNDEKMQALNQAYRNKSAPTNVLSFGSAGPAPAPLGDIALGFETCHRESVDRGISLTDHLCHLFVHGALHLYGFDHEKSEPALEMEALETKILCYAGCRDPWGGEQA